MTELDELLSLMENPTRRRILERIVREPSYPLQLSKELGVSTQAVIKNLNLMERSGVVVRTDVVSNAGPNRAMYTPNRSFTLVVDMRPHSFSAKLLDSEESTDDGTCASSIQEIDRRIESLERERSRLLSDRSRLIMVAKEAQRREEAGTDGTSAETRNEGGA